MLRLRARARGYFAARVASSASSSSSSFLRASAAATAHRGFRSSARLFQEVKMMSVTVDGTEVDIPAGSTTLQACREAGVDIPRFCYHDRLSIAGNCRMCLVEVEKSPKPVASCAFPAMPGMVIKTNTPLVKKAREGVMEFLLANHPLDCPICDQGGECDLQDHMMDHGNENSRFRDFKRGVEDKYLGPLVKTVMTRCIHCTRCVRYAKEIAGVPVMGATGRGNAMEIGTYIDKEFDSEMSGNVIDLCPVGALTSMPYAFRARPWELVHTESVDVSDAVGANIRIDTRGAQVMRILPRLNETVNEEWISDKARFMYDGLKVQRLDTPMVKDDKGDLVPCRWQEAFAVIRDNLANVPGSKIRAVAGDLACAESMMCLKDLLSALGSDRTEIEQGAFAPLDASSRANYLFNSSIAGIDETDCILLIGSNPRMEAPLINARIRKNVLQAKGLKVASLGPATDLTYKKKELGNNAADLKALVDGTHPFSKKLANAKKPMVIVGTGALNPELGGVDAVMGAVRAMQKSVPALVTPEWNGVNLLHTSASRVASCDLGLLQQPSSGETKVVYLLGADAQQTVDSIPKDAFVIYQGHHGDVGAYRADVILPGAAYTEKQGTYVNMEGRVQRGWPAVSMTKDAREDWTILRALREYLGHAPTYSTLDEVRQQMSKVSPTFAAVDEVVRAEPAAAPASVPSLSGSFKPALDNFYFTNSICRASTTMAKASKELPTARNSYV